MQLLFTNHFSLITYQVATFDDLPSARPRKPAPARDAPTAPKPSRPAFEFNSPEDTPKRVKLQKTEGGFVVTAPLANVPIGTLFGIVGVACIVLILSANAQEKIPTTWVPVMSSIAAGMFICGAAFSFSKAVLTLDGEWIRFQRKFIGIILGKRISMTNLKRLSITREQVMVGISGEESERPSTIRRPQIRIETTDDNWEFGKNLKDAHQQYFRYLIEYHYRQWKAKKPQ